MPADGSTGLTTVGARQYDPATGLFMSTDPLLDTDDPGVLGDYTYAADNPVTDSDPSGALLIDTGSGCIGSIQFCVNATKPKSGGGGGHAGGSSASRQDPFTTYQHNEGNLFGLSLVPAPRPRPHIEPPDLGLFVHMLPSQPVGCMPSHDQFYDLCQAIGEGTRVNKSSSIIGTGNERLITPIGVSLGEILFEKEGDEAQGQPLRSGPELVPGIDGGLPKKTVHLGPDGKIIGVTGTDGEDAEKGLDKPDDNGGPTPGTVAIAQVGVAGPEEDHQEEIDSQSNADSGGAQLGANLPVTTHAVVGGQAPTNLSGTGTSIPLDPASAIGLLGSVGAVGVKTAVTRIKQRNEAKELGY